MKRHLLAVSIAEPHGTTLRAPQLGPRAAAAAANVPLGGGLRGLQGVHSGGQEGVRAGRIWAGEVYFGRVKTPERLNTDYRPRIKVYGT
eukprot:2927613-Pyramimonas_sp.AAC.1